MTNFQIKCHSLVLRERKKMMCCAKMCSRCKGVEISQAVNYLSTCHVICETDKWGQIRWCAYTCMHACVWGVCKCVCLYVSKKEWRNVCMYVCMYVDIDSHNWMNVLHDVSNINSEDDSGRDIQSVRRLSTIYYNYK